METGHKLALATLLVTDYDQAITFFVGKLGFVLVKDEPLALGKRWVVVRPNQTEGGLLLARAVNAEQRAAVGRQAGGRVAFFLQTNDFARDHAAMLGNGIQF